MFLFRSFQLVFQVFELFYDCALFFFLHFSRNGFALFVIGLGLVCSSVFGCFRPCLCCFSLFWEALMSQVVFCSFLLSVFPRAFFAF